MARWCWCWRGTVVIICTLLYILYCINFFFRSMHISCATATDTAINNHLTVHHLLVILEQVFVHIIVYQIIYYFFSFFSSFLSLLVIYHIKASKLLRVRFNNCNTRVYIIVCVCVYDTCTHRLNKLIGISHHLDKRAQGRHYSRVLFARHKPIIPSPVSCLIDMILYFP